MTGRWAPGEGQLVGDVLILIIILHDEDLRSMVCRWCSDEPAGEWQPPQPRWGEPSSVPAKQCMLHHSLAFCLHEGFVAVLVAHISTLQ